MSTDNFDEFFKDGPGQYVKFPKDSTTKLRIVSNLIIGWEGWAGNKPVRFAADYKMPSKERNSLDVDDKNYPKYKQFMACLVWNYNDSCVQIWQITQKTIAKEILRLRTDTDWGGLDKHDIKIHREGEGYNTKYNVTPSPGDITEEIKKAVEESTLKPEHLLSDQKNLDNIENFRRSVGTAVKKEGDPRIPDGDKDLDPSDIPFS